MITRVIEGGSTSLTQPYHINGSKGYDYDHWGVDLTGFDGYSNVLAWIVAHSEGTVIAMRNDCVGWEDNSYGNYVLLQHPNGMYTMYGHMSYDTVQVSVGQKVAKGQRLGYMGNTGMSFGGHLHFELREASGYQIDPEPYLNTELPGMKKDLWVENINGGWYACRNGKIDYSYTGLAENENGWWYCEKGKVNFNYTGLCKLGDTWWYCENSKVNFNFNGLAKLGKSWWLCKNGAVDFSFTGLYQNNIDKAWWYVIKGQIDFTFNGVVKGNTDEWLVVKNKVDFSYNGLAQNQNGAWFMFQGGRLVKDFNGLVPNESGTWVVKNGAVNFKASGKYVFSGHEFKVKKGHTV